MNGDREFIDAVRRDQRKIVKKYERSALHRVWRDNIQSSGLERAIVTSSKRSTIARSILTFIPSQIRQKLAENNGYFVPLKSPAIAKSTLGSSIYDGVAFTDEDFPNFVYSISGLSGAEWHGRWSNGDRVIILLRHKLDKKLALELSAFAYGANAGKKVEIRIGGTVKTAIFGTDHTNIVPARMTFSLRRATNRIEIKIPHPTQPPNDIRKVGLGFVRLQAHQI